MTFEFDLFVSYKSEDRPWAARLVEDLRRDYPLLKVFWDRTNIPPGVQFRPTLDDAIHKSAHMMLFWTGVASQSGEVINELATFTAHKALQPDAGKGPRTLFYVPLEGQHSPLEGAQGFAEFRRLNAYDAAATHRGTTNLAQPAGRLEWDRMVRSIGDSCLAGYVTQPVTLAVLAMSRDILAKLDNVLTDRPVPGPTLEELLTSMGLTVDDLKARYPGDAFTWQPFGTPETVLDYMDRLRVDANVGMPNYQFHWVPKDLYAAATRPGTTAADLNRTFEQLSGSPSVVIVDQLSLYHPYVYTIFARLVGYAKGEQAVIISLAPSPSAFTDSIYQSAVSRGAPVLDGYFEPQIPPTGTFARCGWNVQHAMDVKRLIRSSLGVFYVQQKKLQAEPVTKG